jgi:hypothetical protein
MLKTITSRHMTSPLRTLLDSTSHLRYKKGVGEDLFWKAVFLFEIELKYWNRDPHHKVFLITWAWIFPVCIVITLAGIVIKLKSSYSSDIGEWPIGFRTPSVTAFQNKSSPTPFLYRRWDVLSSNVRKGLVICLEFVFCK